MKPAKYNGGYMGRWLHVDLSTGTLREVPLDPEMAYQFVGGSGLGARLLGEFLTPPPDPYAPEAPLIFMTGPFVGTPIPAAGRYSVVARSPLTGLVGEANSGGFWGPELRFAGYDGIFITGQADPWVVLVIDNGHARLVEMPHIGGMDTYRVQAYLREKLGLPKARIATIGPAGERRVRYAAIMNDHGRAAARTGLGAVMGSKGLKAIVVHGNAKVPIAHPESFRDILRRTMRFVIDDLYTQMLRLGGTILYTEVGAMYGDVPGRYYTEGDVEPWVQNVSAPALTDLYLLKHVPCYRCPIACGREIRLPEYDEPHVDGPEYETAVGFSFMIGADNLADAAYAGHLCNRYGLDTISTSAVVAFAFYLYNEGILKPNDVDGLDLSWGNSRAAIQLVEKIARREGIGDVLAEGVKRAAETLGVPELAVHVKGLEVPYHDPRAFSGMALVYATAPRGADHMSGDMYHVDTGREVPELGITAGDRWEISEEKARVTARVMDYRAFTNSVILCHFEDVTAQGLVALLNAVTGWDWTVEDVAQAGERIYTLKRLLNYRLGMTREDDQLPKMLQRPLTRGHSAGYVPDIDTLLTLYYRVRGWDENTGFPLPETLKRLGLEAWAPNQEQRRTST